MLRCTIAKGIKIEFLIRWLIYIIHLPCYSFSASYFFPPPSSSSSSLYFHYYYYSIHFVSSPHNYCSLFIATSLLQPYHWVVLLHLLPIATISLSCYQKLSLSLLAYCNLIILHVSFLPLYSLPNNYHFYLLSFYSTAIINFFFLYVLGF